MFGKIFKIVSKNLENYLKHYLKALLMELVLTKSLWIKVFQPESPQTGSNGLWFNIVIINFRWFLFTKKKKKRHPLGSKLKKSM